MEPDTNPFAAPTAPVAHDEHPPMLEFRANLGALVFAIPFLILCTITSAAFAIRSTSPYLDFRGWAFSVLIAITAAIGAYGCATVFWCRVVVTERAIMRHDLFRHVILLSEIEYWRFQPFPNAIFVKTNGKRKQLALNNWAMSRRNKASLAQFLRDNVGPPKNE